MFILLNIYLLFMRLLFTFVPVLLAASWAIYNIFFLIKKSIPSS
jgi:hypothetical protein